jgi:hypothetical protein
MDIAATLADRYSLDLSGPGPIEIPNLGREVLGAWFKEFGFHVGAEIGVERGIFSSVLLRQHPTLELFCVDAWEGYEGYICRLNHEELPSKFYEAQERLKGYNVHFMKQYSMKAVRRFKDRSLDFVYIDANHDLPWVFDDILQWEKKVRPGGIVAGHDYIHMRPGKPSRVRVAEALGWYTELKPIKTWFLIGRQAKIEGEIRDNDRSWFWVKQ